MSVFRDKKEWNKWNEMVLDSEHALEDFRGFSDDRAIVQADKKIQSLLSKNKELERQLKEAKWELKHQLNSYKVLMTLDNPHFFIRNKINQLELRLKSEAESE